MKKFQPIIKDFNHIIHGADYNPDQWIKYDPDIINKDMRLMKLANMNSMSVAIFAWSSLEPEEGVFDFSFLDEAMDKIAQNGGKAVLATPSGARPAWLAEKYPEVLRTDEKRVAHLFGERHNHCFTSPVYREKTAIINEKLAERYKDHEALGVWHISNEFSGECHCPLCRAAFTEWLRKKYNNDLDKLNFEYWTSFWSHTYTSWEQIAPPSSISEKSVSGLNLDWKRFVTHQTAEFIKSEIEPLKRITPDIPVTTNMMSYFDGLNYAELAKCIDVISWDDYPEWLNSEKDIDTAVRDAMWHDVMRSLKKRPFLLMESTPSMVNWRGIDKIKRPGMHRAASLLAVAHGSDSVQYFQFRKSRNCTEQHHGAVVDHCGHENTRVFREVSQLGAELKKLDCIVGTYTKSEVAFVFDWENKWALDDVQYFNSHDKKMYETFNKHYKEFWKRGINVDFINYESSLDDYKLIIMPMMYSVPESFIKKVEAFVRNGGTAVTTYMAGMVNENNLTYLGGWPANELGDVFGIWNEEISCMLPGETVKVNYKGKDYAAVDYCEVIHANAASVLGSYREDYFAGKPAVCKNDYGKGTAYYIAFRDEGVFLNDFYSDVISETGIERIFESLPEGVGAAVRSDGESSYVFLHNFSMQEKLIPNSRHFTDAETGTDVNGDIPIERTGVRILKITDY